MNQHVDWGGRAHPLATPLDATHACYFCFVLKKAPLVVHVCREGVRVQIPDRLNLTQAFQMVRHHFNIFQSSCVVLALRREVGHRKLVTRFGVIGEYNKRFSLKTQQK